LIAWEELTLTPSQKTQSVNPLTRRIEIKDTPLTSPITESELIVINPRPKSSVDEDEHIVAAHIKGLKDNRINVVVITDLDFLAKVAYEQEQALESSLDNYRLLQNTIEVLAGKSGFVSLRSRRSVPRTLTAFEKNVAVYREQRAVKEKENELAIEDQLAKARKMLEESLSTIESDQSTNFFEKLQQSSQTQLDAQEQFDRKRLSLEKQLRKDNDRLKAQEARQVSQLENFIRLVAVGLAPLPALLLGIFVFFRRAISESSQVRPDRKVQR
jgi:hypothetical protein